MLNARRGMLERTGLLSISLFLLLVALAFASFTSVASECVVIIQGGQDAGETSPTNTSNALITAIKSLPAQPKIVVLRPQGNAGQSATTYKNKKDLLAKLKANTASCKNVIFFFIGHGLVYEIKREDGTVKETKYGFWLGKQPAATGEQEGLFANDFVSNLSNSVQTVSVYADCCHAKAIVDKYREELRKANKTLPVSIATCKKKTNDWPSGPNEHCLFTRYFLENYYLILTDPNTMHQATQQAEQKRFSVLEVIMHSCFQAAKTKTKEDPWGARGAEEKTVQTIPKVQPPNRLLTGLTPYNAAKSRTYDYRFRFYTVAHGTPKKCVVVGYVTNSVGLPIAPIRSVSCTNNGSQMEFKYSLRTTEHTLVLERNDKVYKVTISTQGSTRKYRASFLEVNPELKLDGLQLGYIYIYIKPHMSMLPGEGWKPTVIIRTEVPGGQTFKRALATNITYKPDDQTLSFKATFEKKKHSISIQFKAFGEVSVKIDTQNPYPSFSGMPRAWLEYEVKDDIESLEVPEGETATFSIKLTAKPWRPVVVQVAVVGEGGDPDIEVSRGAALTFTRQNWNVYQTVTVSAKEDTDSNDGQAKIRVSKSSGDKLPDKVLTITEKDNDK